MSESYHIPVLLEKSVEGLNINPSGIYVDVTFGGGGHSKYILSKLNSEGRLFSFDQDQDVLNNVPEDDRFKLIMQNFRYIKNSLLLYGIKKVDGILADLGVSSHQFDTAERGFSFRFDADLDMRMNKSLEITAKDILNNYSKEELIYILSSYGEVYNTKTLVNKLISTREETPFTTTTELIKVLEKFTNQKSANKYYAQVFQALRIEVNQEMKVLQEFLESTDKLLKPNGRLSVITYHSLEDRMVKRYIQSGNIKGEIEKDFFGNPLVPFKKVNRKPILATDSEIVENSRARSAKLRIAEKLND